MIKKHKNNKNSYRNVAAKKNKKQKNFQVLIHVWSSILLIIWITVATNHLMSWCWCLNMYWKGIACLYHVFGCVCSCYWHGYRLIPILCTYWSKNSYSYWHLMIMAKTSFANAIAIRCNKYELITQDTVVGTHINIDGCTWYFDFFVMGNIATYFVVDRNTTRGYNNSLVAIIQLQIKSNKFHIWKI